MAVKTQTNTKKILSKIIGEIETAKNWERHINACIDNEKKRYTPLDMERQYWFSGRKRLEDVKQWILNNIEEV